MQYYFIQCIYYPALILLCLFTSLYGFSSGKIQASDIDYYIHNNPSFSLIFSENFLVDNKKDIVHLHKKLIYYDDIYKEIFPQILQEKPIYVFASPRNQISNAIASSIPFLRVLFFPTGVGKMTYMAVTSWEDTLIAHEMAHIFQLGQTSDSLKYLKMIFRNSEVVFIPIPVFLNVNLVMPLFLLEGHAVLSESLFASGGRMYSGAARALVFSQLKNSFKTTDQFIKHYLINITKDTFTINQQYIHGGYFFNSLLQKYNIKHINKLFTQHAKYFITPISFISIKASFETVFGTSFESLVNYYIQTYLPLAVQQSRSQKKALFYSDICPPFNKKDNKIFFLTSDLKSTPLLRTFDLRKNKWGERKKTFSPGKIFKIKNNYYVSSSRKINTTERVYGLFSDGMFLKKKYKSRDVQSIYKNQFLSIDTSNNMNGFKLFLNEELYDTIHSPALFGPKGNIYYFKQQGEQRVMLRNKKPLFQFKGFYGKPVDIDQSGTVYFIAATLFGSSLFAWNSTLGIHRVSPSDTIIEAIKGPEDQLLICEVEPHFYSYKLTRLHHISEQPAFYNYPFKTVSNTLSTISSLSDIKTESVESIKESKAEDKAYMKKLQEIDKSNGLEESLSPKYYSSDISAQQEPHQHDLSYSPYQSLKHIRFNGIELSFFYDPITEYNGIINIGFRDPLEYNSLHLSYQQSLYNIFNFSNEQPLENWVLKTKYINTAYRLSWDIQYLYKQGFENFGGARAYSYIHEFSQGILFPVFRVGYWSSSVYMKNAVSWVKLKSAPQSSYFLSVEPSWQLQYKRKYNKNFDFHRHFFLQASIQYYFNLSKEDSNFLIKTQSYYKMNWGSEFYSMPFFNYKTALKKQSIPFRYFKPLNALATPPALNLFLQDRVFEETNDLLSTGIKFTKFIEVPIYFSRFPFSIRGIAPQINGKLIQFLDNTSDPKNSIKYLLEGTIGLTIGLLFHHKIAANLHLYFGYSHPINNLWSEDASSKNQKTIKRPKTNSFLQEKLTHNLENNFHFGFQLQSQF